MAEQIPLLVYVDLRHNSVKMGDRWFWEVLDEHGHKVRVRLRNGVLPFGWALSESSAYRQARRMKWIVRAELRRQWAVRADGARAVEEVQCRPLR